MGHVSRPARDKKVIPVTSASHPARSAFLRGRELLDNNREAEASAQFHLALELDPKFALAHSYLGHVRPGPQGLAALRRGVELAREQKLPRAEQDFAQLYLAVHMGDFRRESELLEELVRLAPDDWHVTFEFGQMAYEKQDWESAVTAYSRSIEVVQSCGAYNNLGYALGMQDRLSLATAALRQCANLSPNEPNAHDSLGEVELAAGGLEEAEKSFRRAAELDKEFYSGYHGVAIVRFLRGDWDEGYREMARARAAATQTADQLQLESMTAWAELTDGRSDAALARVEAAEKVAKEMKAAGLYEVAALTISRSMMLNEMDRPAEAIAAANLALTRAKAEGLTGIPAHALRRRALVRRAIAELHLGKKADGRKTLLALEDESRVDPTHGETRAGLNLVRGLVAEADGDFALARSHYLQCRLMGLSVFTYDFRNKPEEPYCAYRNYLLATKMGDLALAEKLKRAILLRPCRDPMYLYLARKLDRLPRPKRLANALPEPAPSPGQPSDAKSPKSARP